MNEEKKPVIVLGVTGSIAAYKGADLCGKLAQIADVHVVMTANATEFVTPLTFQTLSRNQVTVSLWEKHSWQPGHVSLADIADLAVVAPATADIIAKAAHGIADDALSTFLATIDCPLLMAPAMNPKMWKQSVCRENCELLRARGVHFSGPVTGRVACGAAGMGRMAEVTDIFSDIVSLLKN